jgi:hypothetical protein
LGRHRTRPRAQRTLAGLELAEPVERIPPAFIPLPYRATILDEDAGVYYPPLRGRTFRVPVDSSWRRALESLGTARKRDLAYQVFQNLGEINMELATGSAYHQDGGGQHQHWGSADRVRVLTARWPS